MASFQSEKPRRFSLDGLRGVGGSKKKNKKGKRGSGQSMRSDAKPVISFHDMSEKVKGPPPASFPTRDYDVEELRATTVRSPSFSCSRPTGSDCYCCASRPNLQVSGSNASEVLAKVKLLAKDSRLLLAHGLLVKLDQYLASGADDEAKASLRGDMEAAKVELDKLRVRVIEVQEALNPPEVRVR
jgi:hypothetical protein